LAGRLPPLALLVKAALVLALIGGVGWWVYGFTHPAPVQSSQVQNVDAYAIAEGLEPTTVFRHVEALGETFGDFSLGGRHMLLVTHRAADGQFLHLHLNLSRRYLANHGRLSRGKFYLSAADIQLVEPDGRAVAGLFLTGQQRGNSSKLNLRRLPENSALPFGGEFLDPWRTPGQAQGAIEPQYRLDGVLHSIEGEWELQTASGLKVRMTGEGPTLVVSWEPSSTAWRAAAEVEDPAPAFETFGYWPIQMLFPRPAGAYQLRIGDQTVPAP